MPTYVTLDGRESTVSLRHLAPQGSSINNDASNLPTYNDDNDRENNSTLPPIQTYNNDKEVNNSTPLLDITSNTEPVINHKEIPVMNHPPESHQPDRNLSKAENSSLPLRKSSRTRHAPKRLDL